MKHDRWQNAKAKDQAVVNTGRESGDPIAAMKRVTIVEPRGSRRVVYQKWRHLKHKEVQTNANLVGEIKTHREAVCPNRACTDL